MKKKKSGAGTDETYNPKWEFFEAVKFLNISPNSTEDSISVGSHNSVPDTEDLGS